MDENSKLNTTEREIAIRKRVHRLAEFYQHLLTYIIFNLLFCTLASVMYMLEIRSGKFVYIMAMMTAAGWGIGVLTHAVTVMPLWDIFSNEWEERKVRALMDRQRR